MIGDVIFVVEFLEFVFNVSMFEFLESDVVIVFREYFVLWDWKDMWVFVRRYAIFIKVVGRIKNIGAFVSLIRYFLDVLVLCEDLLIVVMMI